MLITESPTPIAPFGPGTQTHLSDTVCSGNKSPYTGTWGYSSVMEHLTNMCKALGSIASIKKKKKKKVREIQLVKVLAVRSDDLSLIPRAYMVEREK